MAKKKITPVQKELLELIKQNNDNRFFSFDEMKLKCSSIKSFDASFNALCFKGYMNYHPKPERDMCVWELAI